MKAEPVVLIHGEEIFLVDQELADIERETGLTDPSDMNRQSVDATETEPGSVINTAKTLPFLAERRLIMVKNAGGWKTDQWEKVVAYAKNPNPSTCLVLVVAKPDKRLGWWKNIQKAASRVVEAKHPKEGEMAKWAAKLAGEAGLKISPAVSAALGNMLEPDLGLLWREILKLKAYAGEDGRVDEEEMRLLVGETRATNVFDFCDALGNRDPHMALKRLKKLLELGEAPIMLLYMIARHFRMLWKVKDRKKSGDQVPGVPPFVLNKLAAQAAKWDTKTLHHAFEMFLNADLQLKSGGGEEQLYNLVLELTKRQPGAASLRPSSKH